MFLFDLISSLVELLNLALELSFLVLLIFFHFLELLLKLVDSVLQAGEFVFKFRLNHFLQPLSKLSAILETFRLL